MSKTNSLKIATQRFSVYNINLATKRKHVLPFLPQNFQIFICQAICTKLSKVHVTVIWTHDRDVRGMGPFPSLRHKVLCNPVFKEILHCKAVRDVKSRIDPCFSWVQITSSFDNCARLARKVNSEFLR